jgi:hypothetical protein
VTAPPRLPRDICLQCGAPGIPGGLCGICEAIYDIERAVIGVADPDISRNRSIYLRQLIEDAIETGSPPAISRKQLRHILRHLSDAEFEAVARAELAAVMAEARR